MAKWWRRILSSVRQAGPVAELIDYELRFKKQVQRRYGFADGLPTVGLFELLPEIEETIEPYSFLGGSASPVEMAILKGLARGSERCSYLEIGTFRGESVANVAAVAERCVTIALPPDEMRSLGYPEEVIDVHGVFSRQMENVTHVLHNSQSFDFSQLNGKFDLIFIDGDHAPDSVRNDTENAFRLLRDRDSSIVWHDMVMVNFFLGISGGSCPTCSNRRRVKIAQAECEIW